MRTGAEADQIEHPAGSMAVGVLVEHPLPRASPKLHSLRRIVKEVRVGVDRLAGALNDEKLRARLEPLLDAEVRVRDDGGPRRGELEGATR